MKHGHEIMDTVADIRKAKELMGWAPTVSLDEGLQRTMKWFFGKY